MEARCDTPGLAADREGHRRAAHTALEEHKIVEGQVVDMMAARIVHSLGQEPGEEGELVARRRLLADSRFGKEVGMAVSPVSLEGKVQAAVGRKGWEAGLGEDKDHQEGPMRFAEQEEDIEMGVGHIEL